jgi:preprotein translocase subunit YajC
MLANFIFFMGQPGDDSGIINLIFLGLIFLTFYFFIIRPQSKKQKEVQKKVSEMKKGDKVVTSAGILGTVKDIADDSILVEVDTNVKVRFLKSAITDVNPNKAKKEDK